MPGYEYVRHRMLTRETEYCDVTDVHAPKQVGACTCQAVCPTGSPRSQDNGAVRPTPVQRVTVNLTCIASYMQQSTSNWNIEHTNGTFHSNVLLGKGQCDSA